MFSKIQTGNVQRCKIERDRQAGSRNHSGIFAEDNRDQAGLAQLSNGLAGAATPNSIDGEAALLGDSRFLAAQRQVLAVRIRRRAGNRHLHSVIAQLQRNRSGESGSTAVIQRVPFNPADDRRVLQGGVVGGRAIEPCDIDLLILMRLYSLGVLFVEVSVTNPDGDSQAVRFTQDWASTHAGRVILRGRIRHHMALDARAGQVQTVRTQIGSLTGDAARLADLQSFLAEAQSRETARSAAGADATESSPAIVDEAHGTGSIFVCRGYRSEGNIGIQEPASSAAECARIAARRGIRMRLHAAVDISGPANTGVYSPLAGVVLNSYESSSYGHVVRVHHPSAPETTAGPHRRSSRWDGREVITSYCHLNARLVARGQSVFPGQAVGLMGNTGLSGGTHTHFSVQAVFNGRLPLRLGTDYENNASLNPTAWFSQVSGSPAPYRQQVSQSQTEANPSISGSTSTPSVQRKRVTAKALVRPLTNVSRGRLLIQRVTDNERYENTLTNAGTTRAVWESDYLSSASFLGINITSGVHQELADRLALAEDHLRGQFPGRTDAEIVSEIGLYSMSGRRAVTNAVGGSRLSLHSFGLAVDVNYRGNPFIGRSEEVDEIINRIFHFMTGNEFHIRTALTGTATQIRTRLEEVSEAFAAYFRMRGDRDLIREHLASRNEIINLPSDSELINPWQEEDDRKVQEAFDQIEADATNTTLLADMEMTNIGPRPLAAGFIDLSEALVQALTTNGGLYWGAQYRRGKDIMHFDWRAGTIRNSHRE